MKLKNFKISGDNIGIELSPDEYLDLHNNFDLKDFNYDFKNRTFEINLLKNAGDWVPNYEYTGLQFRFSNVSVLRTKELDQDNLEKFPEDDLTISMVGFTNKDDKEFLGVLASESIENLEELAMVIYTENGQAIIVYAETVEVEKLK